jgi:DNA uptake protein ComE-like DNA-binding protein
VKNKIKDFFSFSKSERNGIIILLSLTIFLAIVSHLLEKSRSDEFDKDALFEADVKEFLSGLNVSSENKGSNTIGNAGFDYKSSVPGNRRYTPFPFDPNTLELKGWVKMGFSEKQANVILKYREKGGRFYRREDFKKLFIIDKQTYSIFESYITIPTSFTEGSKKVVEDISHNESSLHRESIEINGSDSAGLTRIYGIGPVLASRIIKYREKLGGFCKKSQLMEVYGIDSVRFNQIENQVDIDTSGIKRIFINKVSLNDLRKCPYLDYYMAKKIIDKRVQKGKFYSMEEISALFSSKPEVYSKIAPYITL